MDGLFLRQVWSGNAALLESLARQAVAGGDAADALHYFLINKGPWSRLDHHKPFIPGVPAKPESANFYPAGATKDEIQKWLDSLSGSCQNGGDRLLHDHPPRTRRPLHVRAVLGRISGRADARRPRCCVRPRSSRRNRRSRSS